MNTMHGALVSACWNRSRTRAAPTPTNISTNSDPLRLKNGTFASPATARASSVLPVPGGPTSSTPFGMRPPRFVYFRGFRRNSTISFSSSSASSTPATPSFAPPPAEFRLLPRFREKPDDLLLSPLPSTPPRHIREAHLHIVFRVDLRLAPGKRHHAAFGAAHSAEEKAPHGNEQHE